MNTTQLTVRLPASLSEEEAKLLLAIKLYEVGKVSMGLAARLAGLSRRAFLEMLGRYQVPIFDYSPAELREETLLSPAGPGGAGAKQLLHE